MNNIEINKDAALDQMYDLIKKSGKYIEIKSIIPEIKDDFESMTPLGKIDIKGVGEIEIAFMISVLKQTIEALREYPRVKDAEKMINRNFETERKIIKTNRKEKK